VIAPLGVLEPYNQAFLQSRRSGIIRGSEGGLIMVYRTSSFLGRRLILALCALVLAAGCTVDSSRGAHESASPVLIMAPAPPAPMAPLPPAPVAQEPPRVITIPAPPPKLSVGMARDQAVTPLPPESVEWKRHQSNLEQQDRARQRGSELPEAN